MYLRELLMSFSFTNLLGTIVNITSLSLLVVIIIGIWKRKKKARIGVIVYSFLFLFGVLYGSMKAYSNMDIYQPDGLATFIIFHSIWIIAFLAFSISLVKSQKVKDFFNQNEGLV